MERVLEIRQYDGDTLIRSQRLTAAILAAAQPDPGSEPARWRAAPALRAVNGELVLCITGETRGAVLRGEEAVALDAYPWRRDPDFAAVQNLPIPSDGETVLERPHDTLRLRWVDGKPSALSQVSVSSFDSPYWNSLAFSLFAHLALVLSLLLQPTPLEDPPKAASEPFLERAAILLPPPPHAQKPPPRPRMRGPRRPRASMPLGPSLAMRDIGGAFDSVFGEGPGVLTSLAEAIEGRTERATPGDVRGEPGAASSRPTRTLGPGGFPRLATEVPPVPRSPVLGPRRGVPVRLAAAKICDGLTMDCALPKSVIQGVIGKNRAQIRACYERVLQRDSNLEGRLFIRWVIGRDGRVARVSVVDDSLGSREVAACVTGRIGAWRFPAPAGGGTVEVRYPFVFRSVN